jgi:hypothetical protein
MVALVGISRRTELVVGLSAARSLHWLLVMEIQTLRSDVSTRLLPVLTTNHGLLDAAGNKVIVTFYRIGLAAGFISNLVVTTGLASSRNPNQIQSLNFAGAF